MVLPWPTNDRDQLPKQMLLPCYQKRRLTSGLARSTSRSERSGTYMIVKEDVLLCKCQVDNHAVRKIANRIYLSAVELQYVKHTPKRRIYVVARCNTAERYQPSQAAGGFVTILRQVAVDHTGKAVLCFKRRRYFS
eukprot:scaffold312841_cov21-Prasinocladus_malaysianus.AAC.1